MHRKGNKQETSSMNWMDIAIQFLACKCFASATFIFLTDDAAYLRAHRQAQTYNCLWCCLQFKNSWLAL